MSALSHSLGFGSVGLVLWLWMFLWEREEKVPFFDVGMFCALATLVYTIYPLVNYWVDGLQFGLLYIRQTQFLQYLSS